MHILYADTHLQRQQDDSLLAKMGLISTWTMIRSLSLFHLTAAYLFLTNPRMIVDQNVVFMLGESMRLVRTRLDSPKPLLGRAT